MKRTSSIFPDQLDREKKCGSCDNYDCTMYVFGDLWMCQDCILEMINEDVDGLIQEEIDDLFEIDNEIIQAAYTKAKTKPIICEFYETLNKIFKP